ncbi:hypothetical protein MPH_04477 [Macrophomina phaseolina MS6]|uniref:Uncharacterized protein n=1 Tax=Macrophomina phaseolina (strain MS6) TaxID=1126212 RepID=K2RZX7_MACPH|nr:hypothetical protein MPH_04477 [Macrophomina phaseolina MS6]
MMSSYFTFVREPQNQLEQCQEKTNTDEKCGNEASDIISTDHARENKEQNKKINLIKSVMTHLVDPTSRNPPNTTPPPPGPPQARDAARPQRTRKRREKIKQKNSKHSAHLVYRCTLFLFPPSPHCRKNNQHFLPKKVLPCSIEPLLSPSYSSHLHHRSCC